MIHTPHLEQLTIKQDGTQVILLHNGTRVVGMPWGQALVLAKALQTQARRAEEIEKHEQVAFDHALMLRTGAPCGLAFNCKIRAIGEHEAAWNGKLRRYLPGGVKSREKVGTPTLCHAPAKEAICGPEQ